MNRHLLPLPVHAAMVDVVSRLKFLLSATSALPHHLRRERYATAYTLPPTTPTTTRWALLPALRCAHYPTVYTATKTGLPRYHLSPAPARITFAPATAMLRIPAFRAPTSRGIRLATFKTISAGWPPARHSQLFLQPPSRGGPAIAALPHHHLYFPPAWYLYTHV